jgi:hypothetical protein
MIPDGSAVVVDAREAMHVDLDVVEMLREYHANAASRGVDFQILGDPRGRTAAPPVVLKKALERKIATSMRVPGDAVPEPAVLSTF